MKQPLRVLIAEDNPDDTELILRELRRAGFDPEWERVDTEAGYLGRLDPGLDIILSDCDMPQFSGSRALQLLRERGLDIPFIIVSGTIGEDSAVAAMKQGAADYLLKDRMARLGPAVVLALEQRRLHKESELAGEAMRQSEHKYRHVFESLSEAAFLIECASRRIVDANLCAENLLGRTRAEILGMDESELFPANESAESGHQLTNSALQTARGQLEETALVTKDGRQIPVQISVAPVQLYGRSLVLALMTDITVRKRAEERVREQAAMLDQAHDAIIVRDIHTRRITYWNQGAERLYGWTAAEAEGRDIGELIHVDPTVPDAVTAELLKTGEWRREIRHVTKAGRELTVSGHVTLVRDSHGAPKSALAINIDMTGQKDLEARLLHAQRMESIGTLASGVAHDLNNILSPIMMSAPLLRRDLTAGERDAIVSTIEMSAERGAQIVKQVLTFGSGLDGERRPLQVDALMKEMMRLMRGTFPKNLAIESSVAPNLWPVMGDATQLHQVLLNLCVNARDAMPEGGRLRLRAAHLELDASYASMLPEAVPGPFVLVEISDTGGGIAPEIVGRIFDPFFTTKGVGKGTGLGLSTVHGIVKSHGGLIHVNTQPGNGTTFQIYLPASPDHEAAPADPSRALTPQGHGELVLVVDDEPNVRAAVRIALETAGYRVLLAADGTAALAEFAMNSGSVAAVFTDLMMPFMDGVALTRALRRMAPVLPIIASTGLGEKAQLSQLKAMGVETVLHKPYDAGTLLRSIRDALHPEANSSES